MNTDTNNCSLLTQKVLSEMEADNYSYTTTHRKVYYIYRSLVRFCNENYSGLYTPEAGQAFLSMTAERTPPLCHDHMNTYRRSIKRLDLALEGNFHWDAAGFFQKHPYVESCFSEIVETYESFLRQAGKTEPDIRNRLHVLARFLKNAEDLGLKDLSEITPDVIYKGYQLERSHQEFTKSLRSFFNYAFRQGLIDKDLRVFVPSSTRNKPVPTVYPPEDIENLLASIDRDTSTGKRNYCIVLLAARLGLRSSDIAGLKFSDVHTDSKKIHLIQQKTGEIAEFPLTAEIEEALNDYVDNARPDSVSPYFFLRLHNPSVVPVKASTIYTIVSKCIATSGIDTAGKKRGAHALRSSLASQLLEEGNSYPVISKVLGHKSSKAAKSYIRIDADRLRICAVEVPPIQSEQLMTFLVSGGREK